MFERNFLMSVDIGYFFSIFVRYVKIDNKGWFVVTFKSVIFGFSNRGISTQNLIYNDFNIRYALTVEIPIYILHDLMIYSTVL